MMQAKLYAILSKLTRAVSFVVTVLERGKGSRLWYFLKEGLEQRLYWFAWNKKGKYQSGDPSPYSKSVKPR